jgi:RNA polymerase-interacting CarD/CdnL/TRCF family regulator
LLKSILRLYFLQQDRKVVKMTKYTPKYSLGDRVVHYNYGVGQIDGIERKPLNGIEVECFKVKTKNGVYWFPTDSLDNPRIHHVASHELIQRAIEILRSAPRDLESDPVQWKERIDDVKTDGDFLAISSLVRDLAALKTKKRLNLFQTQALKNLKDRLIREWAASLDVDAISIRPRLRAYLRESNTLYQNVT